MPRGSAVATDNFNRASLGSDWANLNPLLNNIAIDGSTTVVGTIARPVNEGAAARWVGAGSFDANQWAGLELSAIANLGDDYRIGVVVRASGDTDGARDWYEACIHSGAGPTYTTHLGKLVNGTWTQLHSAAVTWVVTDRISLEIEGNQLRVFQNTTELGGAFSQPDTDLTTGLPGVAGSGGQIKGDNWEAGNFIAAVGSVVPVPNAQRNRRYAGRYMRTASGLLLPVPPLLQPL